MAWKDRLRPASFRGVRFHVQRHDSDDAGRRLHVHEYPGSDEVFAEDLGQLKKEYRIEGFLVGDDYPFRRDALRDACNAKGPGRLVHPYLGELHVSCGRFTVSERTDEGRMARVVMKFISTGPNVAPRATRDTADALTSAADSAQRSAVDQFRPRLAL